MDAFQHVNNTVYFRYFESARIEYFVQVGLDKSMKDDGVGPILASTSCRFRVPLTYPDRITVGARVADMGADRFTMLYKILSHEKEQVVAEGEGLIVIYDYKRNSKTLLPENIRDRIEALTRP